MKELLYVLYLVGGAGAAVLLVRIVLRSKQRLDDRVAEFKEEQADNQGPAPNPWVALAQLYAEDEQKNDEARRKKKRPA